MQTFKAFGVQLPSSLWIAWNSRLTVINKFV